MVFERARRPEQKEQRREALLEAADRALAERGLADASLSAIARGAGLSKANVYRYFESREAIYLELLRRDFEAVAERFEGAAMGLARSGDLDAVARAIADALTSRPRALELLAQLGSVLERNVSPESIRAFKRAMKHLAARQVFALHAALPGLAVDDAERALRAIVVHAGGLHPLANPGPAVAEVLAEPEFADEHVRLDEGIEAHARLVLRGLRAAAPSR
ncbi:MAG TPA: TetR family transcriptional regulator [Sandaracinaceae bacterium LLY-WYZ-13_1]|nr:TetR family transcriptional regulator [Sandaracinaceae bacterium LLY-WYZ-13_1]